MLHKHIHTHTCVHTHKDFNMQTHKPVGFEITAVVREYTEMPSAYKDMHIEYSNVGLQLYERHLILFDGNEHDERNRVRPRVKNGIKNNNLRHLKILYFSN